MSKYSFVSSQVILLCKTISLCQIIPLCQISPLCHCKWLSFGLIVSLPQYHLYLKGGNASLEGEAGGGEGRDLLDEMYSSSLNIIVRGFVYVYPCTQ